MIVVLAVGARTPDMLSGGLDRWLTLTVVALVGAAKKAVEIGAEYAKQRHAFGTPIGTFQAVSHPLADSATAVDGARLLGLKAACAFAEEPDRASELAAMAFVFAYETARDATHHSLHIHGGYGFGMEQDIQLYYRRARGWAMVYGEPWWSSTASPKCDMARSEQTSARVEDGEAQGRASGQSVAADVGDVDVHHD